MPVIKSLEELKRVREEALQKKQMKAAPGKVQVIVAMGTCGIAAGARDTMKSILHIIESENLSGVSVTQTGCMGVCEQEPILQVVVGRGTQGDLWQGGCAGGRKDHETTRPGWTTGERKYHSNLRFESGVIVWRFIALMFWCARTRNVFPKVLTKWSTRCKMN